MNSELYGCSPHFHHIIAVQYPPYSPLPPIQSCEAESEAKSSQLLEQLFGHLMVYGWRALPISIHNGFLPPVHHTELFTRRPLIPQPTESPARTTSIHTGAPFHNSYHNSLGSVYPPTPLQHQFSVVYLLTTFPLHNQSGTPARSNRAVTEFLRVGANKSLDELSSGIPTGAAAYHHYVYAAHLLILC
ncbi:hypothetical protein T06_13001 [Trichinella sp. T6]|nr:hypothetical protein T06_13001 [Trichinella sp. T6]